MQDSNGTLFLELEDKNISVVNIADTGTVSLDGIIFQTYWTQLTFAIGKLQYKILTKPVHSKNYGVLTTNGTNIRGTFVGSASATPGSHVSHDLPVQYTNQQVILVYLLFFYHEKHL